MGKEPDNMIAVRGIQSMLVIGCVLFLSVVLFFLFLEQHREFKRRTLEPKAEKQRELEDYQNQVAYYQQRFQQLQRGDQDVLKEIAKSEGLIGPDEYIIRFADDR